MELLMLPKELEAYVPFANALAAHSRFYRDWTEEQRLKCVKWHADMGLFIAAEDPEITPDNLQRDVSFSLFRLLSDIQFRLRRYHSDPAGHIIFVDYLYKGSNAGVLAIFMEGYRKYKDQVRYIAYHRENRPDDSYTILPVRFCLRYCKGLI